MLGGPLPGEEGRPAGEAGSTVQDPPLPTPRLFIGHVLGEGFRILMRHLVPILLLTALLVLPFQYLLRFGPQSDFVSGLVFGPSESAAVFWTATLLVIGLTVLLPYVLQGWIADGVVRETHGSSRGFLRGVGRRIGRTPAVLGAAFLLTLLFFGVMGLAAALAVVVGTATHDWVAALVLLLVGGLVVVILSCVFYVTAPAAVLEGVGPWKALCRSVVLTRGARFPIFAVQLVLHLSGLGVGVGVNRLLGTFPGGSGSPALAFLSSALVAIVFAAMQAVCAVVAYTDLRRGKEGDVLEEHSAVFD